MASALARSVAIAAVSPDGRLVALVAQRTATSDLVARERVHVHELATGDEVFALDGPDVVRALVWTSPVRLLVGRDGRKGFGTLTLHEAPDGGEVGRRDLPHLSQHQPCARLSMDGARLLVTSPSAYDCQGPQHEVAHLLALPSLDVIARVDCAAVGDALGVTLGARDRLTVHPDGHLLAAVGTSQRTDDERDVVVVIPVARPLEARVVAVPMEPDALRWLGPSSLVLSATLGATRGALRVITCEREFHSSAMNTVLDGGAELSVEPYAVHPDCDRVLAVTRRRVDATAEPAEDPWDDEFATIDHLEVIRCSTGERMDLGERYGWIDCACWALGGRAVANLVATPDRLALQVTDLASGLRATRKIASVSADAWVVDVCGGDVVTLTLQHQDGAKTLEFVDPAAMLRDASR